MAAAILVWVLIGVSTGVAGCYVAPADEKPIYFLVGLFAWPIVALALLAEFIDERRASPSKLPVARVGWPRTPVRNREAD